MDDRIVYAIDKGNRFKIPLTSVSLQKIIYDLDASFNFSYILSPKLFKSYFVDFTSFSLLWMFILFKGALVRTLNKLYERYFFCVLSFWRWDQNFVNDLHSHTLEVHVIFREASTHFSAIYCGKLEMFWSLGVFLAIKILKKLFD